VTSKIFPERVSSAVRVLRCNSATAAGCTSPTIFTFSRNGGQLRLLDGNKEKYQAYLLNEVTLEIAGQTLKPGAYGIGFLNGGSLW